MSKLLSGIMFLLLPAIVFAQPSTTSSAYQPATITQVKLHQTAGVSAPSDALYEVSVKINGTTYVVLTKSPSGDSTILYVIGRQLLVQVNEKTITWNDILGESHEVPIVGQIADTTTPQSR